MSSDPSTLPPNDPKVIAKIVDKLKKQGLFDKFRKDCMADIDTKPAYQNLCRRVEGFVTKFLDGKEWTPHLNKNRLRESLRKEITEGTMLSNGVDQLVNHVVNPKIYKVFKPEIDAVVCEYFGITPGEREEKLRLQEEQRQTRLNPSNHDNQSTDLQAVNHGGQMGNIQQSFSGATTFGAQNVMNMQYNMMNNMQNAAQNMNMANMSTSMAQSIQSILGQFNNLPINVFPNMPPTVPNFSVPPPGFNPTQAVSYDPSVPPPNMGQSTSAGQTFSSMSQTFANSAGFQQVQGMAGMNFPGQGGMVNRGVTEVGGYPIANTIVSASSSNNHRDNDMSHPGDDSSDDRMNDKKNKDRKQDREKKKKEVESLTVEDLLNITIPPSSSQSNKSRDKKAEMYSKERSKDLRNSPVVSHVRRDSASKSDRKDDRRLDRSSERRRDLSEEKRSDPYDERHSDRFDERRSERMSYLDSHQERERERELNRRSEYSSSRESSRSSLREPHPKQSSHSEHHKTSESSKKGENDMGSGKVYHFAWDDKASDISDYTVSSVHTSDLSSFDEQSDGLEDISSGELNSEPESPIKPPEPPPEPTAPEFSSPKLVEKPKPKPRKLIALQYNYSDSEEEETREERKARIARDKEDRYIRRQLRRAELEAKRLEREEERKIAKQKKAAVKKTDSDESPAPPVVEESPTKSKKVRPLRTKEALKEQLRTQKREQRVQQMALDKRMASRRQRKRNSKYMSDDFTSIFTDKKKLLSDEGYIESSSKNDPDYYPGPMKETLISPSTPTQDEVVYSAPDNEVVIVADVLEISSSSSHTTRSQTRHLIEERSVSPFSDNSERSRPESDLRNRRRGRKRNLSGRVSPGVEEKKPVSDETGDKRGPPRRVNQRYDMLDLYKPRFSWRRQSSPTPACPPESVVVTTISLTIPTDTKQVETERAHSQRYDDSDLYKPHTSYRSRRRGASPPATPTPPGLADDFRMHASRRGIRPASPPPMRPNVRTRPPSPPPVDEPKATHWQRYASNESVKSGKSQRFPGSPERPPYRSVVGSPEHTPSKLPSVSGRDSDSSAKPVSPEHKSANSGSQSDDGAESRLRVPLSKVNFGMASQRSRNDIIQERGFGDAAKWSQRERSGYRSGGSEPVPVPRQFRPTGSTSPRAAEPSTRAGMPRERTSKSGAGSLTPVVSQKYAPQGRVPDWDSRSEQKRGVRKPPSNSEHWSRHTAPEEEGWTSVSKTKVRKDDKEDWEPISDEDVEYRSKRGPPKPGPPKPGPPKSDKHKMKPRKPESHEALKPKGSYDRPKPQYQEKPPAPLSDEELDEDGPDPEDLMQLIPYESELEDFDFTDSPEAKEEKKNEEDERPPSPKPELKESKTSDPQWGSQELIQDPTEPSKSPPPEPQDAEVIPPREIPMSPKKRTESCSSGELKEEPLKSADVPELPKAGKSPSEMHEPEAEAELPRPGVSPTAMLEETAPVKPPSPSEPPPGPSTPYGNPVSSPESGEVGDDDSPHMPDDKPDNSPTYGHSGDEEEGAIETDSPCEPGELRSSSPPSSPHLSQGGHGDSSYGPGSRDPKYTAMNPPEMPMTRASRKRSEEESLPVAKRLRR